MTANGSALDTPNDFTLLKRPHPETNEPVKRADLSRSEEFPASADKSDFISHQLVYGGAIKAFWYIPDFSRVYAACSPDEKYYSNWFASISGDEWRISIIPKGPKQTGVGVFVERRTNEETTELHAFISIKSFTRDYGNTYTKREILRLNEAFDFFNSDWGNHSFYDIVRHAYIFKSPLLFEVTITVSTNAERSRELTGYVGLINEGTTCYLNSLFQTLFFIRKFRQAIFSVPPLSNGLTVACSLQTVFRDLETSQKAVSTKVFHDAFGWDLSDLHIQHDIQEFSFKLCDALEANMKGTSAEGTYPELFEGQTITTIQCLNVEVRSNNTERFFDIQLDVMDCDGLTSSLDKYTAEEQLIGDNQYSAEGYGKQDAVKTVKFNKLPPVLQIQLKRFELNPTTGRSNKINNRFEFYPEIDLTKYSLETDCKYKLFSVIVHSGNTQNGHYYAFVSPKLDGNWFKFNDASVEKATISQVIESNYGGYFEAYELSKNRLTKERLENEANAYMLVYVKTSASDLVIGL